MSIEPGKGHGRVQIVEVAPRDGLQNEDTLLSTAAKLELIERLVGAGARRIEATSFVHPKRVPQMADAEEVMAGAPRQDDVSYIGLALNRRGVDRALAAGCDEVNVVVVATDTFSQRNQGTTTETSIVGFAGLAEEIHAAGRRASLTIAAAFGCPFEGEVAVDRVVDLVRRGVEAGADEIALADTIGVAVPTDVTERLAAAQEAAPDVPFRIHLHNTRNTGIANAWAAYAAGVTAIDASLGGIGGCPFAPAATGNIATEDLVYLLNRSGVTHDLDLDRLVTAVPWLESRLQAPAPGMLAKAGTFPAA